MSCSAFFMRKGERSSLGRLTEDLDAVVFDFDGTVVDSNALKAEAFGKMYETEGPEVVQAVPSRT